MDREDNNIEEIEDVTVATVEEDDDTSGSYKSQREIDRVIGRRIRKERERWGKQHEKALRLEAALGDGEVDDGIAALLAHRMGVSHGDVLEAMEEGGDIAAQARRLALMREAAEYGRLPGQDVETLIENPTAAAMLEAGEPLERVLEYFRMDDALEEARVQAREEAFEFIRTRGVRPPALSRPAQAAAGSDFANMPDEVLRAIDERLKRGEKVRI